MQDANVPDLGGEWESMAAWTLRRPTSGTICRFSVVVLPQQQKLKKILTPLEKDVLVVTSAARHCGYYASCLKEQCNNYTNRRICSTKLIIIASNNKSLICVSVLLGFGISVLMAFAGHVLQTSNQVLKRTARKKENTWANVAHTHTYTHSCIKYTLVHVWIP